MKTRIFFILISLTCLFLLQELLMPKYMSGVYEGNLIQEYYSEDKNHEVIIIGDCEVYENISPITLWENYGITSYIRGSAQQLIWQSYYLLEETLKYEKPKVVVFNVLSMKYDTPQNEAYNRMTLDGMKLSRTKIDSILASGTKDESLITYLIPLLRYHDRWRELSAEDFTYFGRRDKVSHNGFMLRSDVKPVEVVPEGHKLPSYEFGENSYLYLDKMTKLCKENGIELVLIKAPSLYPYWYDQWEEQMVEYADKNSLMYINFLELIDEVGIDFDVDTYDAGLHLNVFGAEKLSQYLGEVLSTTYGLSDLRDNPDISAKWNKKSEAYYKMKEAQLRDLAEFGAVKTFIVN